MPNSETPPERTELPVRTPEIFARIGTSRSDRKSPRNHRKEPARIIARAKSPIGEQSSSSLTPWMSPLGVESSAGMVRYFRTVASQRKAGSPSSVTCEKGIYQQLPRACPDRFSLVRALHQGLPVQKDRERCNCGFDWLRGD